MYRNQTPSLKGTVSKGENPTYRVTTKIPPSIDVMKTIYNMETIHNLKFLHSCIGVLGVFYLSEIVSSRV